MDRIEKLERAVRWQRLCITLLGVMCLLGAKMKTSFFEAVEAKIINCADFSWTDPVTLRARSEVHVDQDETEISATSPNGRNYIDMRANDKQAYLMISIGDKAVVIDEEMVDSLNRLVEETPWADDSAASPDEPAKSQSNPARNRNEK